MVLAAGAGVIGPALWRAGIRGWPLVCYTVGLAPALGFGPLSLLFFYARLGDLARPGLWTVAMVLASVLVLAVWCTPSRTVERTSSPGARGSRLLAVAALLALATSGIGALIVHDVQRRAWPEGTHDAVAVWNVRALFFYRDAQAFPARLREVEPRSHPHYPLFLPLAVAGQYALAEREAMAVPQATALAFVLATGFLLVAVLADVGHWPLGALAAALFWTTPVALLWGFSQGADGAVGYFLFVAVAALAAGLDDGLRLPRWLGGLALGLLAWTKNEGLVLAGLTGALYLLYRWAQRHRISGRELATLIAWSVPGLAALLLMKTWWAPESGLTTYLKGDWRARILQWQRWSYPLTEFAARFVGARGVEGWSANWPVLLAGGVIAGLWARRGRANGAGFWLGVLLLATLSFVGFYAVAPYEQRWLVAGSIDRLMLQLYPVAIGGVFLAIARLGDSPAARSGDGAMTSEASR